MPIPFRRAFVAAICCLSVTPLSSLSAQEPDALRKIPTDPQRAVYLSAANLKDFEELLIAPVADFVRKGLFAAKLARTPQENWSFSALWNQATRDNEKLFTIGPQGELLRASDRQAVTSGVIGFPFFVDSSENEAGQKILWNLSSVPSMDPQALLGMELVWFGRKAITRQASGLFLREYLKGGVLKKPENIEGDPLSLPRFGAPIEFRELLQLLRPAVVFGYASLTYRYKDRSEDDFWTFSPVLGRSRRALESNRSDAILGGELSLDDFFLFSGRPERFTAKVVAEKTILAPFPQRELLKLEPESTGEGEAESLLTARGGYRNRKGQNVTVLWNADTGTFVGMPGWIPATIHLIPRSVWILEVNPKDPFSSHGTEVLVVDRETFIPFYKVVYDKKGYFSRFCMASWMLLSSQDERVRFPVPTFVLGVERGGEHGQALEVPYVRHLTNESTLKKKLELLFDIREHDKRMAKKEEPAQ